MTLKEIIKKGNEKYPQDIIEIINDDNSITREDVNFKVRKAYIQGLIDNNVNLPSGLDEAAIEYANKEYPDEAAVGQWGTGDYEPPIDMEYPREIAKDAFIAGAEWMAGKGETLAGIITKVGDKLDVETTEYLIPEESEFERGDNVTVQIRKIELKEGKQ